MVIYNKFNTLNEWEPIGTTIALDRVQEDGNPMKKLEVSKILVLTAFSISLVACGTVQEQTVDTNADLSSLKSVPVNDGGQTVAKSEGGNTAPVEQTDGGNTKIKPEGGNTAPVEQTDGGNTKIKPDGGSNLVVELYGNVLVIQGKATQKDQIASVILNGREFYELQANGWVFETKMELSEEELKGLNIQIVIDKIVTNYYYDEKEGLRALTFK